MNVNIQSIFYDSLTLQVLTGIIHSFFHLFYYFIKFSNPSSLSYNHRLNLDFTISTHFFSDLHVDYFRLLRTILFIIAFYYQIYLSHLSFWYLIFIIFIIIILFILFFISMAKFIFFAILFSWSIFLEDFIPQLQI